MFTNAVNSPIPIDIQQLKKPIIGYVGALQSIRLNISLLVGIAKQCPEWSIVLVGPEDEVFKTSELHQLTNIHFLGSKPPAELPNYIHAFDVCLNPQLVNQVTIGNYPRKIDEYLAMGKPIVATATEAMTIFQDYTYLGNSIEDYIRLIAKALTEDKATLRAARQNFAASHTWENNVKEIYKAINQVAAS